MSQQPDDSLSELNSFLRMVEEDGRNSNNEGIDVEIDDSVIEESLGAIVAEHTAVQELPSIDSSQAPVENVIEMEDLTDEEINEVARREADILSASIIEGQTEPEEIYVDLYPEDVETNSSQLVRESMGLEPENLEAEESLSELHRQDDDRIDAMISGQMSALRNAVDPVPQSIIETIVPSGSSLPRVSETRAILETVRNRNMNIYTSPVGISRMETQNLSYLAERMRKKMKNDVPEILSVMDGSIKPFDLSMLKGKVILDRDAEKLILIQRTPDNIALFEVKGEKVEKIEDLDEYFYITYDFIKNIRYDCLVLGFLDETIEGKYVVLFDCLNYNGKYIGEERYNHRFQYLHMVSSRLMEDTISVISPILDATDFIEQKGSEKQFVLLDTANITGQSFLLQRCIMAKDPEQETPK